MTSNTIKSSFFVRKSGRLSMKKTLEEKSDSPVQKCSEFDSIEEPTKKSATVTSALKNVFQKRDKKKEERSQESDAAQMLQVRNAGSSPISPVSPRSNSSSKMGSCCGMTSSHESVSFPPGSKVPSGTVTPVTPHAPLSTKELTQACRRLLSPSKRKSDDENELGCCSISPVKSPKSSPDDTSPIRSINRSRNPSSPSLNFGGQVTPKSCSRLNSSRASRVPTSTPRRLFGSPERKNSSQEDFTPKKLNSSGLLAPNNTPNSSYKQKAKLYQSAKRSLHTAKPDRLIGRDSEIVEVEDFISDRLSDLTSGSLYISGPPGTGKTAVIQHVVENLKSKFPSLKSAFINCMTLKDSNAVFCHTHEQLKGSPLKGKDAMKAMERLVTTSKTSILLILDEIDQLDSKHQDVLIYLLSLIFDHQALFLQQPEDEQRAATSSGVELHPTTPNKRTIT
ncbi:cell division control protein 6 homolog [Elysia marginata]|uniref:Cell division control protein 6 homolog n=1 Tax=Elysia marginata TaxID=1093978 RepID=A0AAV4FHU1_9GAST|nr:cell division control protein 6 homolog [Elysia marginata]